LQSFFESLSYAFPETLGQQFLHSLLSLTHNISVAIVESFSDLLSHIIEGLSDRKRGQIESIQC
jgi:hypothetical protein